MVLFRRVRRLGRLVAWGVAVCRSGLRVEGLEEEVEVSWGSGPGATRLEDEAEGWIDGGARPSRLEEEADGTWEVGAVELRLVEGLVEALVEGPCEVVGGEVDCTAVTL